METSMRSIARRVLAFFAAAAFSFGFARAVEAADADADETSSDAGTDSTIDDTAAGETSAADACDEASDCGSSSPASSNAPLACDGALCDTTNDATCGGQCALGSSSTSPAWIALVVAGVAVGFARRVRRETKRGGSR